jgi:hypothetical protein
MSSMGPRGFAARELRERSIRARRFRGTNGWEPEPEIIISLNIDEIDHEHKGGPLQKASSASTSTISALYPIDLS